MATPRPPVVALLLTRTNGEQIVQIKIDGSLKVSAPDIRVGFEVSGQSRVQIVSLSKNAEGDWIGQWSPAAELGWRSLTQSQVVLIRPEGWTDGFPLWFRHPVRSINSVLGDVPPASQRLADGRSLLDPEQINSTSGRSGSTSFETLIHHAFGTGYNPTPFEINNVHAEYPGPGATPTAVGKGWTWVALPPAAPFKTLYTCFQRRQPDLESNSGVPSGGGWHEIGDNAETIFNDLEREPILVGSASSVVDAVFPGGSLAYGMTDVATIRWLRPGEAFVTPQGGSMWGYDQGKPQTITANYHWFIFQQPREVCTEEWVHPCVPSSSNGIGLSCGQ